LIINLIVVSTTAKTLGATNFGMINYSIALYELLGFISDLGVDNIAVREFVKGEYKLSKLLGSIFAVKIMGTFVVGLIVFLFNNGSTQQVTLTYIVAGCLFFEPFKLLLFYLQARTDMTAIVYARIGPFILCSVIKLLMLYFHMNLYSFVAVIVLENLLTACLLYYFYSKQKNCCTLTQWRPSLSVSLELLKNSFPLIFSNAFKLGLFRLDQIMLSNMISNTELGYYASAYKISHALFFIPTILYAIYFPFIVEAKKQSHEAYMKRLKTFYALLAITAYVPAIIFTLSANIAIHFLFGQEYITAVPILIVQIWSLLFVNIEAARSAYLFTENKTYFYSFSTMLGCMSNILLNLALVPRFHGLGAAIASLVSLAITGYFSGFLFKEIHGQTIILTKIFFCPYKELTKLYKDLTSSQL